MKKGANKIPQAHFDCRSCKIKMIMKWIFSWVSQSLLFPLYFIIIFRLHCHIPDIYTFYYSKDTLSYSPSTCLYQLL